MKRILQLGLVMVFLAGTAHGSAAVTSTGAGNDGDVVIGHTSEAGLQVGTTELTSADKGFDVTAQFTGIETSNVTGLYRGIDVLGGGNFLAGGQVFGDLGRIVGGDALGTSGSFNRGGALGEGAAFGLNGRGDGVATFARFQYFNGGTNAIGGTTLGASGGHSGVYERFASGGFFGATGFSGSRIEVGTGFDFGQDGYIGKDLAFSGSQILGGHLFTGNGRFV